MKRKSITWVIPDALRFATINPHGLSPAKHQESANRPGENLMRHGIRALYVCKCATARCLSGKSLNGADFPRVTISKYSALRFQLFSVIST
jgi:hypothetical protein